MKQKKENISRTLVLLVLLALASAPEVTLLRQANAQERNVNERLNLRALGIDNEARQISSLIGGYVRFLKRSSDLQARGVVLPRDVADFKKEAEQRKADLVALQRQFEGLMDKLTRGNRNESFDAQLLAEQKNSDARSALTQAGGARKLFEAALAEFSVLRESIDEEVRLVGSRQQGALRSRSDRVLANHARPPAGKFACNLILSTYLMAVVTGPKSLACDLAELFKRKGCGNLSCPN